MPWRRAFGAFTIKGTHEQEAPRPVGTPGPCGRHPGRGGNRGAAPDGCSHATPIISGSTCFPGTASAFVVDRSEVVNNEKETAFLLDNGGDELTLITGRLVMRFQNHTTGKSIVRDVSGATTEVAHTDGSGIKSGTGKNWWGFGPNGQKNTGEPALVFTSGPVAVTFANGTGQKFYLNGTQEDGCVLLSGNRE